MTRSVHTLSGVLVISLWGLGLAPGTAVAKDSEQVQRGAYLATVGGCHDCHTPFKPGPHGPEPDMSKQLSGHPQELTMPTPPSLNEGPWAWAGAGTNTAFSGPWGVSFTANLTPDPDTGLGRWTAANFIGALRTGKHLGVGRPIMPPMPWFNYAQMTDEDLTALFAYLRSVPPIRNHVPAWIPPVAQSAQR